MGAPKDLEPAANADLMGVAVRESERALLAA